MKFNICILAASVCMGMAFGGASADPWSASGNQVMNSTWTLTVSAGGQITAASGSGVLDLRTVKDDCGVVITGSAYGKFQSVAVTEFYANAEFATLGGQDFAGNKTLTKADFSASALTAVSYRCCKGCTVLSELLLPSCLESVGAEACSGCTVLATVDPFLPASVRTIGASAFYKAGVRGCLTIPEGVTNINTICQYVSNLQEVQLPNSIVSMEGAFQCQPGASSSLTNIVGGKLPAALVNMTNAFANCLALDMPQLDMGGCTNLTVVGWLSTARIGKVILPPRVREIAASAFLDAQIGEVVASPAGRWKSEMRRTDGIVGNKAFYRSAGAGATLGRVEFPWGGRTTFDGSYWFMGDGTLTNLVFFGKALTAKADILNKSGISSYVVTMHCSKRMDGAGWLGLSTEMTDAEKSKAPEDAFGIYSHDGSAFRRMWMVWKPSHLDPVTGFAISIR